MGKSKYILQQPPRTYKLSNVDESRVKPRDERAEELTAKWFGEVFHEPTPTVKDFMETYNEFIRHKPKPLMSDYIDKQKQQFKDKEINWLLQGAPGAKHQYIDKSKPIPYFSEVGQGDIGGYIYGGDNTIYTMPNTTTGTVKHELTHYMDNNYPLDKYKRSKDTLQQILSYLTGRIGREQIECTTGRCPAIRPLPEGLRRHPYYMDNKEILARAGKDAYNRYRTAIDDGAYGVDQDKVDSLAEGRHLRGESVINDPRYVMAQNYTSGYTYDPLSGQEMLAQTQMSPEDPKIRDIAKEEALRRMEQYYARSYNNIKANERQKKINERAKGGVLYQIIDMINNLGGGASDINRVTSPYLEPYSPDFKYSMQDKYEIPYNPNTQVPEDYQEARRQQEKNINKAKKPLKKR
jgi:hypothetical protein